MTQIEEFTELLNIVDMNQVDMKDQIKIMEAAAAMVEVVKPILLKYALRSSEPTSFIIKL